MKAAKSLKGPAVAVLGMLGRLAIGSPRALRATGSHGLASRGGLILVFLVGLGLSVLRPPVGLVVMIVTALAIAQFLLIQYRGAWRRARVIAWLAAVAVVLVAIIAVVWLRWAGRSGTGADVVVLASAIGGIAVLPLVRILFRLIFGPHHPESPLPAPHDPVPLWLWIGGVTDRRATIVARTNPDVVADSIALKYDGSDPEPRSSVVAVDEHRFARFELGGLLPDHRYDLHLEARHGGKAIGTVDASFTTFPTEGEPASVTLAFGSCASTGSRGWVFDTIGTLEPRPRIFVVTGDLHYEDLTTTRIEPFLETFDRVHASHPQHRLYTTMPFGYVWDDHDFGGNDSHAGSRSKHAVQAAYRMAVPSYLDDDRTGAIHQAFTIGRTRVVLTDNRSERDEQPGHLIGPDAEAWLIAQILDPRWPLVIWVSPTPWISDETDSDNWGAYPGQRQRIATAIRPRRRNLVMVAGDAHMVAIDDGTKRGFAGERSGFPVLHAAALDRLGSTKGKTLSHGRFPGGGQFGVVSIDDRGDEITVDLAGRSWTGAVIVSHTFTVANGPPS